MKRIPRLITVALVTGLALTGLMALPAIATEAGTWFQYPEAGTEYFAEVQQPINSANTSNWSVKSKGAVPIKYQLQAATTPAVFESIGSDSDTANDFAFLSFAPSSTTLTFVQITELRATYDFSLGDCHGGSLRWQVRVDSNGNGLNDPKTDSNPTGDAAVFIYYGELPNFTDCTTNNQSGVNMIDQPDLRYDTTQFGGPFYDDYDGAVAKTGNSRVWRASLVLDSGWGGDQRLEAGTTATVNGNTRVFDSGSSSPLSRTCDLPEAHIQVTRVDPQPDGAVNETPVQASLVDDGDLFRVVDCMYQFNLSIPSLLGKGTYDVEIVIDGQAVDTNPDTIPSSEVRFDLR